MTWAATIPADPAGEGKRERYFIWPHYVALYILALGAMAWATGLPEEYAAAVILISFAVVAALHPANGVTAIALALPFFLAPSSRPYIWMLDAMAWYMALLFGVRHLLLRQKKAPRSPMPMAWPAGIIVVVAALALPLDIMELPIHIWMADLKEAFTWWLSAHPLTAAIYPRVVMDLASGVILFFVAIAYFPVADPRATRSLFGAISAIAVAMVVIGSLVKRKYMMFGLGEWTYLGLAHSDYLTQAGSGIHAFAYNRQYFAIYLLLCVPMAASFFLSARRKALGAMVSLALVSIAVLGLVQSGQRSPMALFVVGCVAWGYLYARSEGRRVPVKTMVAILLAACFVLGAAMAIFGKNISGGLERYSWDYIRHDGRVYLWRVAGGMFAESPLLGVGTGKYTYRFYDFYDGQETLPSGLPITHFNAEAHSLYFQILAEQGALGLAVWLIFLVMLFFGAWRFLGAKDQDPWAKRIVLTWLVSLLIWIAFANFNNMFFVRVFGLYFWAGAGIMTAAALPVTGRLAPYPLLRRGILWTLALAFIFQMYQAWARPIPHYFATGFHAWETREDGSKARWTTRKAVLKVDDFQGPGLRLKVSAPLPGMESPQKTTFWYGGERKEVELGGEWVELEFQRGNRGAPHGLLWIESKYMVNPREKGFSADDRNLGIYMMEIKRKPQTDGADEGAG